MPPFEDLVRLKAVLAKRLLAQGLKGRVVHRSWTWSSAAAAEAAATNVHGVGVGRKFVSDRPTRTWAIRLHVVQKLPESLLTAGARLPETIDGLPTDVVQTPPAFFAGPRQPVSRRPLRRRVAGGTAAADGSCSEERHHRQRPVVAGISAAHRDVTAGTIGYFCRSGRSVDDAATVYALSNNHVFADANRAQTGDEAYQPGALDGGTAADRFGTYGRSVALVLDGTTPNAVDAAVIAVVPDIACEFRVCRIGTITGVEGARIGYRVRKHGRTTGYTEGRITDIAYDTLIGADPRDPNVVALFLGQIRIDRAEEYPQFALPGDSGALIVNAERLKAVGLFFACPPSGEYGVANPISEVLDRLEVALV